MYFRRNLNSRLKAKEMRKMVSFPKELLDMDKLWDTFYKNVKISPTTFLENTLNINRESENRDNSRLREKVERVDWKEYIEDTTGVNAFYSQKNIAAITAGYLQGIYFSSSRPKYLNYGVIGQAIGHEITHGFDDQGSQRDDQGNLVDWWRPETKNKLETSINHH